MFDILTEEEVRAKAIELLRSAADRIEIDALLVTQVEIGYVGTEHLTVRFVSDRSIESQTFMVGAVMRGRA